MKLLVVSILLCCLAESFSSPYSAPEDLENPATSKPEAYWTLSDVHMLNLKCEKGQVLYVIDALRDCRSYIKCESGNLPARIYCPPDQVFSKYTLNCEEESQCGSMYVRGDDKWPNPIPLAKIRHRFEEDAILDRNNDLEYSKDTSASQTTPDEMMPAPKYCPHGQVFNKYTLNCQEESQCRSMYVQRDDTWTNPIPLAKIRHRFEEDAILDRNNDLEYSKDTSASETTPDEMMPGPKYCPHDQVCDKYTLNCQEESQCRNMYVQGDDKWTNPIPLAKILHLFEELVVLYRNKDLEYSEDISATENTLDEILIFLDKFLLYLLRIFDIEEQE